MAIKIFLSAVSKQFRDCRDALRSDLSAVGAEVTVQKDFKQHGHTLLEKLEQYIESCDCIIALVGNVYGFEPKSNELTSRYPRRSYTQWEYFFALGERLDGSRKPPKDVFLYFASPEFITQHPVQQTKKAGVSQKYFVDSVRKSGKDFNQFDTIHELRALVLRDGFRLQNYTPQPALSLNTLSPTLDNRFIYRSRQTPFVGREREKQLLDDFLSEMQNFLWLIVSGPGGSGKSRLLQEYCLGLGDKWQAGFLTQNNRFNDWPSWKPSADTLIVIDYTAERISETKNLLLGLTSGRDNSLQKKVRVILVEREEDGKWLKELLGNRSDGYAIEEARFKQASLRLNPMSEENLWQVLYIMSGKAMSPESNRRELMEKIRLIDPLGRPLYAVFAADALTAGHSIESWDRERLMRDVFKREKERWVKAGATAEYDELLALATLSGGLTEDVLETPFSGLELPNYKDFDRSIYREMTGADLVGDTLPPLKPDILGAFFVLNHVKGRNEKITESRATQLCLAAWKTVGGSVERDYFGVAGLTHHSPSSFIIFLRHLSEEFADDPAAKYFLLRPNKSSINLSYWPALITSAIRDYLKIGDYQTAKLLFNELATLDSKEPFMYQVEELLIDAAFSLLPYTAEKKIELDADELLKHAMDLAFGEFASVERLAFCNCASLALRQLLEKGYIELARQLFDYERALSQKYPDEVKLRLPCALGFWDFFSAEKAPEKKEEAFRQLITFCNRYPDDITLFLPLAGAYKAMFKEHLNADQLPNAEKMNYWLRYLVRQRSENTQYSITPIYESKFDLSIEILQDDLTMMEHDLAETDAELVYPLVLTGRSNEAYNLVREVYWLWHKHMQDSRFAFWFIWATIKHAEGEARNGRLDRIPKALIELENVAAKFPVNEKLAGTASFLALEGLKIGVKAGNLSYAEEMFESLRNITEKLYNEPQMITNYAEGAMEICLAYQDQGKMEESMKAPTRAAWALRSESYQQKLHQRGGDSAVETFNCWLKETGLAQQSGR